MSSAGNYEFVLKRVNVPDTIVLDKPEHTYTCGRGKENQIVCHSLTVSRNHCIFFRGKDALYVTDLRSCNGLYVNGIAQTPLHMIKLCENDIVGIGCSDVDSIDNSMFAYRLCIIKRDLAQEERNSSILSRTVLSSNNDVHMKPDSTEDHDLLPKRKRELRKSDTVIPQKIPKLVNEVCSERKSYSGSTVVERNEKKLLDTSKNDIENDFEIIHVSLKSKALEQSIKDPLNNSIKQSLCNEKGTEPYVKLEDINSILKDASETTKERSDFRNNSHVIQKINKDVTHRGSLSKHCDDRNLSCNISTFELGKQNTSTPISNNVNNTGKSKKNKNKVKNSNIKALTTSKSTTLGTDKEPVTHSASHESSKESCASNASCTMNVSNIESNNSKDVPVSEDIVYNGDSFIKMEDELQITDNDEESIINPTSTGVFPAVSPIKLKQIKQEPKTRFSEVDIVNLSDDEDDIFPCSQLFDIGFGMDTSVKEEVKQECTDIDNDGFNRLDDADVIISLSDSEDEDNKWLQRLSRSQILNESDSVDVSAVKSEVVDLEVISVDGTEEGNKEDVAKILTTETDKILSELMESEDAIYRPRTEKQIGVQDSTARENRTCASDSREKIKTNKFDELLSQGQKTLSKENVTVNFAQKAKQALSDVPSSSIEESIMSSEKRRSLLKKVPEIEPPHLPTRRRRSSLSGPKIKEVPPKPIAEKTRSKGTKELREKNKIEQHMYKKQQRYRKSLYKWAECLPPGKKKDTSLTKEEKKALTNDRKAKLKQLAEEEKRTYKENTSLQEKKRPVVKAKAKVSLKTRGDFLISEQTSFDASTSSMNDSVEKTKITTSFNSAQTNANNSIDNTLPNVKINKSIKTTDISKKIIKRVTENLQNSLKLVEQTVIKKTLRQDSVLDQTKQIETLASELNIKVTEKSTIPTGSEIKSSTKIAATRIKKRVSFAEVIKTVREYQIDPQNVMRKFTGKDAPIPVEKLPNTNKTASNNTEPCPKLEEYLLRILMWNPVWLEEQKALNTIAPVVKEEEIHPMLTFYKSYSEYYKIALPLLLLETWAEITKQFDSIDQNFKRPTIMCSIVENSIARENIPSTKLCLSTLMLEVLVAKEDLHRQTFPHYGDLVFFEYVKNEGGKQIFHKVFAYVKNTYQTILTPFTHYNKELANYVKQPFALLTYTMLTKPLENNIPTNRVQRLRVIIYLRSHMRTVQALQYLPQSPVMNLILNPRVDLYQLPSVTEQQACSLITGDQLNEKQLEAVLRVTESVIQKEAKLCFVQGPPGTGKSKVIVNIVTQILYGGNRYKNNGSYLRILVCAPSNAAIDEIVLRLLAIRSTIKDNRFKMVRIGRPESMHPSVKDISVTELAKRDVKRTASGYASNNVPTDSVEDEKLFLEARINAMKCELSTSQKMDETSKKYTRMKLADMTAKYELLKNRKPISEINPRELSKLHRAAEDKLLRHADVITCTLSSCFTSQMESIFGGNRERISVCIVDEATQSSEAETLIPLMLGVNTLVLVGDPNQLPATVLSQRAKHMGLDQSIFSRVESAFDGQPKKPIILLDTQYRMAYAISYWPNKFFYGGKLKNAAEPNLSFPFQPYRILNINTCQNEDKFSNTNEAEFVADMIFYMLLNSNLQKWKGIITFGILTPYNNQRSLVTKKIEEMMLSLPDHIRKKVKIDVNTVDGFQGQERDVIIMSCVRSQGIGFLSDRQRLCVALTRAKHSLLLCGNFNTFMRDQMWNALISDARSRGVYCNVSAKAQQSELKTYVIKHSETG